MLTSLATRGGSQGQGKRTTFINGEENTRDAHLKFVKFLGQMAEQQQKKAEDTTWREDYGCWSLWMVVSVLSEHSPGRSV